MIKRFYVTVFFVVTANLIFAATGHAANDTVKTKYKKFYLVEFTDKLPVATRYAYIDPQRVADLSTLSDSANSEISKLLKVNFVLVVKLMPNTKLLTFDEILDLYKVPIKNRKLPLTLDDEIIYYPETLLVSQNQIEKVEVVKGADGPYISITLYWELPEKKIKKGG